MSTNTVSGSRPLVMAEWVSRKDRIELSLIFMVAAAVGDVSMASRGFTAAAEVVLPLANGVMFAMLWVLPGLHRRNVVRSVVMCLVWTILSSSIAVQVSRVMTDPAVQQEVSSR